MKNVNENLLETTLKKQVSALYDLMQSEKLEELEITETDFHIHLKRKGKYVPPPVAVSLPAPVSAVAGAAAEPDVTAEPADLGETVKSPIMGVFYRAPSPSSPTFVKDGDIVESGKTLCIVEAMKVMNEIKAGYRMKIVKILVENGKAISASQDLFQVEKA